MLDKLKKLKELRQLSQQLKEEKIEIEDKGIKVIINGKMEVELVKLNADLTIEEQEKIIKDCLNKAIKEIQMRIARNMSQFSDFKI